MAFHPRGEWAAVGHLHGRITLLQPGDEHPVRILRSDFGLSWLEPSPDGGELATSHFGVDVIPLTSDTGNIKLPNFRQEINDVRISLDAAQVVTQSPRLIRIWDLATDRAPIELRGSRVLSSREGSVVVVGSQQRSAGIKIWHRDSRMIREEVKHDVIITSFALDLGGTVLATGAADGTVRLWDTRTGELRGEVAEPSSAAQDLTLIEDGRAVAASYPDGSLWVWDAGTLQPRHVLHHPELLKTSGMLAVPSTSQVFTTISNGGSYLWDLAHGSRRKLVDKFMSVDAFDFAPDGRLALALSLQAETGLWSTKTGRLLFTLKGHRAAVEAITVFDRGRQIATGARDGTIGWWSAADGEPRQLLPLSRSGITAIAVSPLNDFLVTGDRDGAVRIRRAESGEEIVRLLSSPGGGWAAVTPDDRWDAPYQGRDQGITAWSGSHHALLADHRDRHAPGLLARVMKPYVEAHRNMPLEDSDRTAPPELAAEPSIEPPAPVELWPQPPSPRDLAASPHGVVRPDVVGSLIKGRGSNFLVEGHRIAFLKRSRGHSRLRIGDLSVTPDGAESGLSRPKWLKELEIPGYVRNFDEWRGFFYLVGNDQLTVIDATEPENAQRVATMPIKTVSGIDAADGMAYLAAECEGLRILELERPDQPVLVSGEKPSKAFGCLKAVVSRGRYVYATATASNTSAVDSFFQVIDVSDPTAPWLAGRSIFSKGSRRNVYRLAVDGAHAYLAAEDFGLLIFDLTNPSAPEQIARIDTPWLRDVAVAAGRAYLADYYLGLQILDVETPSDPRFLGSADRAPEAGHGPSQLEILGKHLLVFNHYLGIEIVRVD